MGAAPEMVHTINSLLRRPDPHDGGLSAEGCPLDFDRALTTSLILDSDPWRQPPFCRAPGVSITLSTVKDGLRILTA